MNERQLLELLLAKIANIEAGFQSIQSEQQSMKEDIARIKKDMATKEDVARVEVRINKIEEDFATMLSR